MRQNIKTKDMKTLEQIAKKDKANEVTKKDGSLKKRVIEAIKYSRDGLKLRPNYYTGSGIFTSVSSYYSELTALLKLAGYKYTVGNDALRGGAKGDYIKISKAALTFLESLILK